VAAHSLPVRARGFRLPHHTRAPVWLIGVRAPHHNAAPRGCGAASPQGSPVREELGAPIPARGPGIHGSPPRARGAQPPALPGWAAYLYLGTIPACAGSTHPVLGGPVHRGDHPRVRGEHLIEGVKRVPSGGPSPRARGAHGGAANPERGEGTIPACAGSTPACRPGPCRLRDHPRVRGEHSQRPANLPAASSRFSNFLRNRQSGRSTLPWKHHGRRIPVEKCALSLLSQQRPPARTPSVSGIHPSQRRRRRTPAPWFTETPQARNARTRGRSLSPRNRWRRADRRSAGRAGPPGRGRPPGSGRSRPATASGPGGGVRAPARARTAPGPATRQR
jgi:hypothetical protein